MRYIKIILLLLVTNSLFGQTDLLPGGVKGRDAGSDSTFSKLDGTFLGKRTSDNIYKNGTLGLRTTDTSGVLNLFNVESDTKPKLNFQGDGQYIMKINRDTGTTLGSDFYFTRLLGNSVGTGVDLNNQVFMMGWNVNPGGGLVDPSKPSASLRMEERYRNSSGEPFSYEIHLPDIRFPGGSGVRPLTGFFSRDPANRKGNWAFYSDFIDFSDYSANQKVTWGFSTNGARPKGISFLDTARLAFYVNNTSILQQRNAAGSGFIDLMKVNGSNQVELSPNGYGLYTTANNFAFQNGMTFQPNNGQSVILGSSGNQAGALEVYSLYPLWMKNSSNTSGFAYVLNGALELRDMSSNNAVSIIDNDSPNATFWIRNTGAVGIGGYPDSDKFLHINKSASAVTTKLFALTNTSGTTVYHRSNASPESVITANPGDIVNTSISSTGGLWLKKTGTGNTGWVDLGALVTESTSVGSFNNTGTSNGLSLSGTALSLHAATISTPGAVNTGQQTFTSGAGSKYFNGTGTAQISVDGNTDATEAGINFTQVGGADIMAQMQVNSSDVDNARFQLLIEDAGSYVPKLIIGSLNDQKGVQESGGLYEEVTNVTSSPYAVIYGDRNIYLDGATITVNLQAIGTSTGETKIGRVIYFFNDNATNVTITPNGSETIADAASLTLLPNTGVTLLAVTGTQWAIRD